MMDEGSSVHVALRKIAESDHGVDVSTLRCRGASPADIAEQYYQIMMAYEQIARDALEDEGND